MGKMKWFVLIPVMVLLASTLQAHTFYKWVDEKGVVNYTDDYNSIPPAYKNLVEIEWIHEEGPLPPVQKTTLQKREEAKTDIYGLGEAYWRGKVRPWKEFLKNAEANYEKAHQRFVEKAMDFSQKRFGRWSKTQYKMNIIELDKLKEEMMKYADQIAEAREAMEKISKEAKEAKADPEWLK
jgi:acyl-CoA reductase-like NAD-dependent aldehyde dehydrogenase